MVTGPAVPVVTADDMRDHISLVSQAQNAMLTAYIAAATSHLDGYTGRLGRALVNQTWAIDLDEWTDDCIRLPLAPVSSITHVKYYDGDNVLQTLSSTNYVLLEDDRSPFVEWIATSSLPTIYDRRAAIVITHVAGYGATGTAVPAAIRQAIMMLAAHFYANREAVIETRNRGDSFVEIPFAVSALIAPFERRIV